MPVLDGVATTRRIRDMAPDDKSSLPVIGLTADAFSESRSQFIAAGMNDVLTKPIEIDALERVLALFSAPE